MALIDLEAFIQQCLTSFDPTFDITSGSPLDVQVIQPILSRVGTDPFTVDIGLFVQTLLNQQFPDMPTKEGDAITDLLIKASVVLWNPIVREISRIELVQSFADPTTLTTDDADALGANLFASRDAGNFATGIVRIYFAQPQDVSVSPSNFITCQQGLHFFPTEVQSIAVAEMMLNVESSLYYFDISVIAEAAGNQYNIGPGQVITIANLTSATRITNKARFQDGSPNQSAVDFVDSIAQDLTERSMVTSRGVVAQLTAAFPELTNVNPIGFNDPEMQRDIITGGGLGPILAAGVAMFAEPDGENAVTTRRVKTLEAGVNFAALIAPTQQGVTNYTLTVANAFPSGSLPIVRDIQVQTVVDTQTLDLADEVLLPTATGIVWVLRANVITLSNIPGGILYPNTPYGTIELPPNQIHIGGCTDIYVRANAFDAATLILTNIIDDEPVLEGVDLVPTSSTTVTLGDFILSGAGQNYSVGDATWTTLNDAASNNLTIEILDPPNAGDYRILAVDQAGVSPILTVDQPISGPYGTGSERWRISDRIFIDLLEPKETKVSGSDLATVQNIAIVSTISGVDFSDYGVAPGDTLRILTGALILGDYEVKAVLSPLFTHIQVDRELPASVSNAKYIIFTPNPAGGITTPFVRIDSIDLLDTSNQPVGTIIPYANPIDCQSNGFANSAHGIKFDLVDGTLGLVTQPFPSGTAAVSAKSLTIQWVGQVPYNVIFSGANPIPLATLVAQINAQTLIATGGVVTTLAVLLANGTVIGFIPVGENVQITGGTALQPLFNPGGTGAITVSSRDVNSLEVRDDGGWASLRPALDSNFDVAQVVDGLQIGFYFLALSTPADIEEPVPNLPYSSLLNDPLRTRHDFNPEVGRHIQVGSRSLGTARLYFLDPTSFQVDANALFTLTNSDGSVLNFLPDPSDNYQTIPPLPNGTPPADGSSVPNTPLPGEGTLTSLSTDFIAFGIQAGDTLQVTYIPLTGTVALADPVVGLNTLTLILSLAGAPDKSIIFIHDSNSIPPGNVTRAGVANQINTIVGQTICSINGSNQLEFDPNISVIVRKTGTANTLLGFSTVADQNNDSLNIGSYQIVQVGPSPNSIVVTPSFSHTESLEYFVVSRDGLQRIVSTTMATQQDASGLYYFDVTLVSQGTGDQYNIGANLQLTVAGFTSDGYYLTTDDSNLTFSPAEEPNLIISRSILEVGVTDAPANATQLSGQNIQINYDQSSLTANVDNFARSDTERVINDSPLGRHLIPYFVRFAMNYTGGSGPTVVIPALQSLILALEPTQALQVSDVEKTALNNSAVSVDNPIDLIAVIHNVDRSITVERSQDFINTGRLAAFFPDVLNVTQSTSS